jgi:hypothetical protein
VVKKGNNDTTFSLRGGVINQWPIHASTHQLKIYISLYICVCVRVCLCCIIISVDRLHICTDQWTCVYCVIYICKYVCIRSHRVIHNIYVDVVCWCTNMYMLCVVLLHDDHIFYCSNWHIKWP